MKRRIPLQAALAMALAAPALAQGPAAPASGSLAPARPALPGAPVPGPEIRIDPGGFDGGAGGDVSTGMGTVVIDTAMGAAHPFGTTRSTSALSPDGADAAVVRSLPPTTLDPAPSALPLCRNRAEERCRLR